MAGLIMKYFVLKPKGTDAYAHASRTAMQTYADLIHFENPQLATALRRWAQREQALRDKVPLKV